MIKELYKFTEINEAIGDCNAFCQQVLGMKPVKGKNNYNAPYRASSDSGAFTVYNDSWHDFVTGESGTPLDLYSIMKCNNDKQQAQLELGRKYNLKPQRFTAKREEKFSIQSKLDEGWKLMKEY